MVSFCALLKKICILLDLSVAVINTDPKKVGEERVYFIYSSQVTLHH